MLDQTLLPTRLEWIECHDVDDVVEAIKSLRVRGAPAIGIAGAYGLAVAAGEAARSGLEADAARAHVLARAEELACARPTAVNLRWAVERAVATLEPLAADAPAAGLGATLLAEARQIGDGAEAAADQALDFLGAARLLAARGLAVGARVGHASWGPT